MFLNYVSREINLRIVYCGPTGSGAATNLSILHARLRPESRGQLIRSETGPKRVSFFDFLPEGLGAVRGFTIRVHVYALDSDDVTVDDCDLSGFQDIDAVVFVADPRPQRAEANIAGIERVASSLKTRDYDWATMPSAVQVLHRGPATAFDRDELRAILAGAGTPWNEASAADGAGIFDTLKTVMRATLAAMAAGSLKEWVDPEKAR